MRGGRGRTPHAGRWSCPRTKVEGALARAPTRPAPSALPCSAFAAPARTALRACAPLAIFTVPACSLLAGARRPRPASAADARGGCTRARESSRLVPLRGVCAAGTRVLSCEFTNPHTNTHKHTGPRGGKCPGVGWAGLKPTQPAQRSSTPGSSPAHSSSAASQLPSERRPGALPPTGAESSGCLRNARHCLRTDGWSVSLCVAACRA